MRDYSRRLQTRQGGQAEHCDDVLPVKHGSLLDVNFDPSRRLRNILLCLDSGEWHRAAYHARRTLAML